MTRRMPLFSPSSLPILSAAIVAIKALCPFSREEMLASVEAGADCFAHACAGPGR